MIFDTIKKSFNTVIDNPSITFYFVLFLIITNFLALYITTSSKFFAVAIILILVSIVLSFTFSAGWLQVIKESVDGKKIKEKNYFTIFLEGIGKNIIPVSIGILIYFIILTTLTITVSFIANYINPNLESSLREIITATQGSISTGDFTSNLTANQTFIVYAYQIGFILISMVVNFILLFYFPSILDDNNKNAFIKPFWALYHSIKFLFKNFLNAFVIFFLVYLFYFTIGYLRVLIKPNNSIALVFLLFIYIYFISSAVVLIFNYYEQKNLCDNRPYSIGENKAIDCTSEKA